jgi:hypothetical protein
MNGPRSSLPPNNRSWCASQRQEEVHDEAGEADAVSLTRTAADLAPLA